MKPSPADFHDRMQRILWQVPVGALLHAGVPRQERPESLHRNALVERAVAEPDGCISVGGLAQELGFLRLTPATAPRVFGKFVEFARRELGWSTERLAEEAKIDLAELVSIESDRDFIPQPRTVVQLAQTLGYSTER